MDQREHAMDPSKAAVSTDRTGTAAGVMLNATTDAARTRYDELYQRSLSEPEVFWLKAAERLDWTRRPEHALELRGGSSFTWFAGGHTNLSFNALDRHVAAGRGDTPGLLALPGGG